MVSVFNDHLRKFLIKNLYEMDFPNSFYFKVLNLSKPVSYNKWKWKRSPDLT